MSLTLEDNGGALVVIHMEHKKGLATGTHQKGIAEEDIYFCHQEAVEDMAEIDRAFGQFDYEYGSLAEGDVMFLQKFGNDGRITDDHACNGRLGGIDDTECKHYDAVLLEEFHDFKKCSHLVLQENGEVLDRGSGHSFPS